MDVKVAGGVVSVVDAVSSVDVKVDFVVESALDVMLVLDVIFSVVDKAGPEMVIR